MFKPTTNHQYVVNNISNPDVINDILGDIGLVFIPRYSMLKNIGSEVYTIPIGIEFS